MTPIQTLIVLGASSLFGSTVSAYAISNGTSNSSAIASNTASPLAIPTDRCSSDLYHINVHRQNHSAPLATYNQTLANVAESKISGCGSKTVVTSGENNALFFGTGDNPYTAAEITALSINLWYNEVVGYNKLTEGFTISPNVSSPDFYPTLAFTQLVWKASTSVGCFAQECGADSNLTESLNSPSQSWDWSWNILCDFAPGGNIINYGEFQKNVGAPIGLAADDASANVDDTAC